MKPHPRIRKAIKWGGLALCLLLAGVWVRSEWVWDHYAGTNFYLIAWKGSACIGQTWPGYAASGYRSGPVVADRDRYWWCVFGGPATTIRAIIPLWLLLAPTLLATAAAWRLDAVARRRARAGRCPKCGYDRAGLAASAVCPECGSLPAEPAPHA
jgi:transposase InsO family protein